jgi:branched-chain amino acid transport system ATP-binding protein
MEILEFMGLADAKDRLAQNLPYGHQKILGVSIALATEPKLLLLDEPLCGMHPEETAAVATLINSLRKRGITIVLVEHNVEAVMRLCNRIAVLNQGKKIAEGTPFEVANNQEVIEAYLGSGEEVC